ncbi:hypothetical protein [Altererythrobacter fulvus]|uniref:hypothetical protein n=1 Tax=Caenibius fulvus TaxID=2126012 RepID=UPI0030182BA6
MIVTVLATAILAFVAALPGLLLCRGERVSTAGAAAAAIASLTVSMMATALIAAAFHGVTGASLPAWVLLPVSLLLAIAAFAISRGKAWHWQGFEWQALAVAGFFVLQGVVTYALAITELPDGSLRIHAWYNADWFKHIGHVFGIADLGLPAGDIFGAGLPLHYYWLSHVLPGAATSIGGDGWAAIYTANAIYSALLAATFYGVVRLGGASPNISGIAASLATFICARPATWKALFAPGGVQELLHGTDAPVEPAFASLALYIPQHALVLALLLGWAVLTLGADKPALRLRMLSLAALSTAMTVSTLFGAAILLTYGLTELYRRRIAAIPELAAMAIASGLLVLALQVVSLTGADPATILQSAPERGLPGSTIERAFHSLSLTLLNCGLPALAALYLAAKWAPADTSERNARIFAWSLIVTVIGVAIVAEAAVGKLIAHELRLRLVNLMAVAVGITGGWALSRAFGPGNGKKSAVAVAVLLVLTALAAPTAAVRLLWHANGRDAFTTFVPADDRSVLADLRKQSTPAEIIWQYPEPPLLAATPGDDNWSAVFAGRTNLSSERATDPVRVGPDLALSARFFAGEDVPVPAQADWIYLSRALHPHSYDRLVLRLERDPAWYKAACRPDACAFHRNSATTRTVREGTEGI